MLLFIFFVAFIILIFCAPYLLMRLTQKENTIGHWYPVTLLYLKHRSELCDDSFGYRRFIGELLNFAAYFSFLLAIYRQNFNVAAGCLAFAGFISYRTQYFILVHKLYRRARTTTTVGIILAVCCLYFAKTGQVGEGELSFYCFILAMIWHIRITIFRAVHWYKLEKQ